MRVVVVGDAHIEDGQNLSRFKALGNKLKAEQPDMVVLIGDFLSLNSLSDWDRNKRMKMEGRRYAKEIDAGNQALNLMGVDGEQKFECHYIEGNHEDRLSRYLDTDPTMAGLASVPKNLSLDSRGVSWTPYKDVLRIEGVSFTHIPINGMGKAIGNPNVAQKALKMFSNSVVFGHTHTLDHAAEHRHGNPHLNQALSVGCFFDHVEDYAKGSLTNYWRGVVDLDIYHNNRFDFTTTSMSQLKRKWGKK